MKNQIRSICSQTHRRIHLPQAIGRAKAPGQAALVAIGVAQVLLRGGVRVRTVEIGLLPRVGLVVPIALLRVVGLGLGLEGGALVVHGDHPVDGFSRPLAFAPPRPYPAARLRAAQPASAGVDRCPWATAGAARNPAALNPGLLPTATAC